MVENLGGGGVQLFDQARTVGSHGVMRGIFMMCNTTAPRSPLAVKSEFAL
jgi:hypothetical protein